MATGVSFEVIGHASFAAWRPGLRGAVEVESVVVGRPPLIELRFEVRRDRWWANAAAASGNIA